MMKDTIDLLSRTIKEIGFPIVVASVLLYFLMTQMPLFRDNMNALAVAMRDVANAVNGLTMQQNELSDLIRDERKFKKALVEDLKESREGHE